MNRTEITSMVKGLKGSKQINPLINYMNAKGFSVGEWQDLSLISEDAVNALGGFFTNEVASDDNTTENNNDTTKDNGDLDMNKVKKLGRKSTGTKKNAKNIKGKGEDNMENKETVLNNGEVLEGQQTIDTNIEDENNNQQLEDNNQPTDNNEDNNQPENIDNNDSSSDDKENENDNDNDNKDNENKDNVIDMKDKKNEKKSLLKDSGKDKPKEDGETKKSIRDKYKTQDNIVFNAKAKETKFEEVRKYSDKTYSCELNGRQLATMFLDGTLIYDPSMQRGVKEDKNNVLRANFKERHVNEIAKAMTEGTFTSLTQIHLGLITDDEDFIDPIYEDGDLIYNGKVRLIDGQHRTKACVKIFSLEKLDELKTDIDLEDIVFNVVIDVVNSDEARIIYQGIDKNLKLDKSQARQLSSDDYARIVNALNTSPDSDLKGKIATAKPTGDKLVLFNNLADSIQKTFGKFNGTNERKATEKYLMEFFAYVTEKLPKAFGNNGADRVEFRSNNLLNENNFFLTWIRLAFVDKENYQANIDKIVENVNFFNKDTQNADGEYIWWKANAIKAKENNKKGFAMQNTGSGINNLTKLTFELLGIKTEQNEEVASDGENGVEVSEQ